MVVVFFDMVVKATDVGESEVKGDDVWVSVDVSEEFVEIGISKLLATPNASRLDQVEHQTKWKVKGGGRAEQEEFF